MDVKPIAKLLHPDDIEALQDAVPENTSKGRVILAAILFFVLLIGSTVATVFLAPTALVSPILSIIGLCFTPPISALLLMVVMDVQEVKGTQKKLLEEVEIVHKLANGTLAKVQKDLRKAQQERDDLLKERSGWQVESIRADEDEEN